MASFMGLFSVVVLDVSFSTFLDVSFRGLFSVVVLGASFLTVLFMCLIKYLNVEIFFHNNVDKIISSYIYGISTVISTIETGIL